MSDAAPDITPSRPDAARPLLTWARVRATLIASVILGLFLLAGLLAHDRRPSTSDDGLRSGQWLLVVRGENETADIHLKGRTEVLPVSRSYLHPFRQM